MTATDIFIGILLGVFIISMLATTILFIVEVWADEVRSRRIEAEMRERGEEIRFF